METSIEPFNIASPVSCERFCFPADISDAVKQADSYHYPTDLPVANFKEIGKDASVVVPQPQNDDGKGVLVKFNSITQIEEINNPDIINRLWKKDGFSKIDVSGYNLFSIDVTAENKSKGYNASLESSRKKPAVIIMRDGNKNYPNNGFYVSRNTDSILAYNASIVGQDGIVYYSWVNDIEDQMPFVFLFSSEGDTNGNNYYYENLDPGETKSFKLGVSIPNTAGNAKLILPELGGLVLNLPQGQ